MLNMPTSTQPPAVRKKLIHHLDTPFSAVSWPDISLDDQDSILELLCALLRSLGQHRRVHIKPSKGKRAARRQAKAKPADEPPSQVAVAPKPELCAKVDVGFNSITRKLEERCGAGQDPSAEGSDARGPPYAMVFVARGNQSSAFNCHFPQMIGVACKDCPPEEKTRLVGFSRACSDRLSSSLGVARVSAVAVARDAPGAEALWEFVQRTVAPVDVSWLDDVRATKYRATRISSVETTVGNKKAKAARR